MHACMLCNGVCNGLLYIYPVSLTKCEGQHINIADVRIMVCLCVHGLFLCSIGDNSIGEEGWRSLCEMLKKNKALKCLR